MNSSSKVYQKIPSVSSSKMWDRVVRHGNSQSNSNPHNHSKRQSPEVEEDEDDLLQMLQCRRKDCDQMSRKDGYCEIHTPNTFNKRNMTKIHDNDNSIVYVDKHHANKYYKNAEGFAPFDSFIQEIGYLDILSKVGLNVMNPHSVIVDDNKGSLEGMVQFDVGSNTLSNLIDKGQKTHDVAIKLFVNGLETLYHMHSQDIVHRDIKPDNIVYDGLSSRFVLIDFGSARFTESKPKTIVYEDMMRDYLNTTKYGKPTGIPTIYTKVHGKYMDLNQLAWCVVMYLCVSSTYKDIMEELWRSHNNLSNILIDIINNTSKHTAQSLLRLFVYDLDQKHNNNRKEWVDKGGMYSTIPKEILEKYPVLIDSEDYGDVLAFFSRSKDLGAKKLSNFYPEHFTLDGIDFHSGEHCFHYSKFMTVADSPSTLDINRIKNLQEQAQNI